MEQTYQQVGLLLFLDVFHPFAGTCRHLLELHTLPYLLVQPTGNGRCQHAYDAYLHTVSDKGSVGLQVAVDVPWHSLVRLAALLYDVGAQQRTAYLAHPLVVHLMARLHVVVANGFNIIFHVVDDAGSQIHLVRRYEVRPVHAGLSLHNVAIVYQQQVLPILLAFLFNIGISASQRPVDGLTLHEVPWKEIAMHVTRLYHLQTDGLITFRSTHRCQGTHHQNH